VTFSFLEIVFVKGVTLLHWLCNVDHVKDEVEMFNKRSKEGYLTPLDGIQRKTLVYGKSSLMTEFKLKEGSVIPLHSHPEEQIGYLISGQIKFSVGSEKIVCNPGDSWCFAGDEEHGVEILQDSVVVEVFAPVREEFLPAGSAI